MEDQKHAPGQPGIQPRWTSSAKTGVGTALNPSNRVWFTLSHGIFDEIYYPRVDQACTRDMGLIVTDGVEFFSEEKRHTLQQIESLVKGVPAYRLTNTCTQGRYRIEKEILSDPQRDAVLQRTCFVPLKGALKNYHVYVLLSPHLGNRGANNTAWLDDYKGVPMLFAQRDGLALALTCSEPWLNRSAGFVGFSDGWQDLNQHKLMTWSYARAENGNVALTGEIDLSRAGGSFTLALGFGITPAEAGQRALGSLQEGFDSASATYIGEWQDWQKTLQPLAPKGARLDPRDLYKISTAVLRTHESKSYPGGMIASLSIPWGFDKGDNNLGGYHLAWPRDVVESAGGLLAAGAKADAVRVLNYLRVTQEADGHWPQNMWLDGSTYWEGIQMDETAFPILLANQIHHEYPFQPDELARLWPMIRRAACFLVQNGPVTPQDRWEEDPGYSPFTLAAEIAALLAAADFAELAGELAPAAYLRETADTWNANIERWIYVTGSDLARQQGVEGYYVRISPPDTADASSPIEGFVPIKNRPPEQSEEPAAFIISPDALALVRFGLRAPDDSRIANTVKVIDALLKTETPNGPIWHRYNQDGYGEQADGSPFDGTGIGRGWPLLVGERAHYELAAGRRDEALRLLHTLEMLANEGGLLPEQVWDEPDIPGRELYFGKPSGSAMPLVWAHSEYVKLLRSLRDGQVFDTPPQPVQRYQVQKTGSPYVIWRFNQKSQACLSGKKLRVELLAPAKVHWSTDTWKTSQEAVTRDTGLGAYVADLATEKLPPGTTVEFNLEWVESGKKDKTKYILHVYE